MACIGVWFVAATLLAAGVNGAHIPYRDSKLTRILQVCDCELRF